METLSQATPLKVLNAAVSYKVVSGMKARTLILTLGGVSGCASGDTKESWSWEHSTHTGPGFHCARSRGYRLALIL